MKITLSRRLSVGFFAGFQQQLYDVFVQAENGFVFMVQIIGYKGKTD